MTILRDKCGGESGFSNFSGHGNNSPTVGKFSGYGLYLVALGLGDLNKVKRRWTSPFNQRVLNS